jgi:hypothetical protein
VVSVLVGTLLLKVIVAKLDRDMMAFEARAMMLSGMIFWRNLSKILRKGGRQATMMVMPTSMTE